MTTYIDGVKYDDSEIRAINKEMVTNQYDFVDSMQDSQTEIKDSTELGDSLKELNNDSVERSTRMSGIDMRSRLHYIEISSILAFDTMIGLRLVPMSCLNFTRQKKRLAVSQNGKGRDDIVDIVAGKTDRDEKTNTGMGFLSRLKGLAGGNKEK